MKNFIEVHDSKYHKPMLISVLQIITVEGNEIRINYDTHYNGALLVTCDEGYEELKRLIAEATKD